jgi:ADP-ribose pyrophosphatase YjhB (NUDIX family)
MIKTTHPTTLPTTIPSHNPSQRARPATETTQTTQTALKRLLYRGLVGLWRVAPDGLRRLALRRGMARVSVGVCALVQDARGRLLLTHHTYREQPWGLPGGFIGRREQPGAALARELCEELGIQAIIGPLVYAETWLPGQHMTLYYATTLRGVPVPDGVEVDGFRFATLDEARTLLGPAAEPWLAALRERRAS